MLIVGARSMLIVGAAPFINGCTNYQHENVDSWCSTVYKRCMLIVGAQHFHLTTTSFESDFRILRRKAEEEMNFNYLLFMSVFLLQVSYSVCNPFMKEGK